MMMMTMSNGLLVVVVVLIIGGGTEAQKGTSCRTKDGQQGTCIHIQSCDSLRGLLGRVNAGTAPEGSVDVLRSSICQFDDELLVCCTNATTPAATPSSAQAQSTESNVELHSHCGINGVTDHSDTSGAAPFGTWPWMVQLVSHYPNGTEVPFCGGTLIFDRYVLTAAHCVQEGKTFSLDFARIGEYNLQTNPDCESGICAPSHQDIPVEKIIVHPSYNNPCRNCNDIALLRLSRNATVYPFYASPICLPVDPVRDMGFSVEQFLGKVAWAAGWGDTSKDNSRVVPNVLIQVKLPIQDLPYCKTRKRDYPDDSMVICAGGEGSDTCRGDGGGPLTLTNSEGFRYFLVGLVSTGPFNCGEIGTQGIYTNVNYYVPWILQNLRD